MAVWLYLKKISVSRKFGILVHGVKHKDNFVFFPNGYPDPPVQGTAEPFLALATTLAHFSTCPTSVCTRDYSLSILQIFYNFSVSIVTIIFKLRICIPISNIYLIKNKSKF